MNHDTIGQAENRYVDILLDPIRVCARYRPKFGQGRGLGLALHEFQTLYQADPFYAWFGLDNPLMYAAHKAAGGMTSIYRQLGIGCERLFRAILRDRLSLSAEDVKWSYKIPISETRTRTLSLDGRIPIERVADEGARRRILAWMNAAADRLGVAKNIKESLTGVVFEVRQGYKSKDSKRQNADIANAATAYAKAYLPCAVILSAQIDTDIVLRYRAQKWAILTGVLGANDSQTSTYDFAREILGYDLDGFFRRNSTVFKRELDLVLRQLLTPES